MATISDTTRSITGLFRSLGSIARNTGFLITAASGVAAAALVTLSQRANQVNKAFREVNSITSFLTDSQEKYGELVSELNTEFGLQINQLGVIDGLYQSLSAGIADTEEAQEQFLKTAGNLAKVGLVDLETSVDVLSTVLNTYGDSAEMADKRSVQLFKTVQLGKVRLEELAPVMGRVAALGSSMGIEFGELSASMAQLTRTGFEARVAATGLRNVIRAMIKPSEGMQEVLLNIAAEQDFFAKSLGSTSDTARSLASDYRSLTDSLSEYNNKQKQAREEQNKLNLQTQRARLAINAIESDRVDLIDDSTAKQWAQNKSISELNDIIDENRIKISDARVQEENYRRETEKTKEEISELKTEFENQVDAAGNLEGNIGELFTQNKGLIETLSMIKERVDETGRSMSDVFPRVRGLQAVLALVGSEGNNVVDIFEEMKDGISDGELRSEFEKLDQETKETFGEQGERFEAFKSQMEDLQNIEDLGEFRKRISGNTGQVRKAMSKVKESATELGDVFNDEVANVLTAIANGISKLTNFLTNLDEKAQENIAQFTVLAVSLGLVVGPALLFVGTAALLAQALGPALIPIVGTLAGFLGILSSVFLSAKNSGQEAQRNISILKGVFESIGDSVQEVVYWFNQISIFNFARFGKGITDVFASIASRGEETGRKLEDGIIDTMLYVSGVFSDAGKFLSKNSDQIASAILKIVEIGVELAIFFKGLLSILVSIASNTAFQAFVGVVIGALIGLISIITSVLAVAGNFFTKFSDEIADFILIASALSGIMLTLASVGAVVIGWLVNAWTFTGLLTGAISLLSGVLSVLTTVFSILVPFGSTIVTILSWLASGFSMAVTVVKVLIGALATFLGVSFSVAAAIVAVVAIILAAIWYFRDEIAAAIMFIIDLFAKLINSSFKTLGEIVSIALSDLSLKEKGKKIIEAIASGMRERINILKNAAKEAANAVADFLGVSSPAPKGPLSGEGPSGFGKNTTESYASGLLEGKSNVTKSVEEATPKKEDFELKETPKVGEEMNTGNTSKAFRQEHGLDGQSDSSMSDMGGKEINVNEKAIFFQKGAFQGVSDEELPRKVRKIIDQSTTEIIKDLEAKGVEVQ